MEILQQFGIDWHLLLLYGFNFLLLFLILRFFAYKPVLNMLDKRKALIEKGVKDADDIATQKENMQKEYKKVLQDANKEAKNIVQNAINQSQVLSAQLAESAKKESEQILVRAREEIALEQDKMYQGIKGEVSTLIAQTLGKVLGNSLTEEEQKRILDKTVKEITL